MKPSTRTRALGVVVGMAICGATSMAYAEPITLQFDVHIDHLCNADTITNCRTVSIAETLTYVFDETIVDVRASDAPDASVRRTVFAGGAMTPDGPLLDYLNPFGAETDHSSASIDVSEGRQPVGWRLAQSEAEDRRTHYQYEIVPGGGTVLTSWLRDLKISRYHESPAGGDGQANASAADFLDELAGDTLGFTWHSYALIQECNALGCDPLIVDPRSFYATGTASLVSPAPAAVPEPGTLLLFGTGLGIALTNSVPKPGTWNQLKARRRSRVRISCRSPW